MSSASDRIADLSPAKLELLTLRLAGRGKLTSLPLLTPQRPEPGMACPLSFAQERMWFIEQLESHNPAYNISGAISLKGRLCIVALEQCLVEIQRRHEILRTSFKVVNGRPVQAAASAPTLKWTLVTLSSLSESECQNRVAQLVRREARRPFEITEPHLLRVTLLRLDASHHVLLLTMHHIVSDGWSLQVLIEEVAAIYRAFIAGMPSSLAELAIQYADFAIWQRQHYRGKWIEAHLDYWKQKLSGCQSILRLPVDFSRPAVQRSNGATQSLQLPASVAESLRELRRSEGVTLFMLMLAVLQALLHRYTGQDDIVVGSPAATRQWGETEKLVGCFVNTLPLRADLGGNPRFRTLLGRVRQSCLEAYAHQELPFEMLLKQLDLERDLTRHPLFQVLFRIDTPWKASKLPNLAVSRLDFGNETAKFDMEWAVIEEGKEIKVSANYNIDIFRALTIARMLEHFAVLSAEIAANPDQRLLEIALGQVDPDDRHQASPKFENNDQFIF